MLPGDAAFSHVTAAQLWGLPLPAELQRDAVLDVMRVSGATRVRRAGCRGHRGLETRTVVSLRGLRVTGLADTWLDLGELTPPVGVDDLVVVADDVLTRLLGPPRPGEGAAYREAVARATVASALDSRVRPRGAVALRDALHLARAPVRSPMETRSRLVFQRAGLPEPRVNWPVRDQDGHWLLEGDLVWEEQRVVGEYQGHDHASITHRGYDYQRAQLARDAGWTLLGIYAADVYAPARRAACLRRFAVALGLDPAVVEGS